MTHSFHPTFTLALIVTTSLTVAFAAAVYCNHLIYVPRFWELKKPCRYVTWLAATMAIFTALALTVIRISYSMLHGPDRDPYGLYKHYAIDLFGMIVHVTFAALTVWSIRPLLRFAGADTDKA